MRPSSVLQQLNLSDDNDTNVASTINDSPSVLHQHEPCIYYTNTSRFFGEDNIYLLWPIDDFAIACDHKETASQIWDAIDEFLAEPLKREDGIFVQHNGIVILQTDDFICPILTISTNVRHRFIAIKNFSPKLKQDQAKEIHRTSNSWSMNLEHEFGTWIIFIHDQLLKN